jgi:Mg/Co/Ni transporter MgtE
MTMADGQVRRIPVVDDDGRLVRIATLDDIAAVIESQSREFEPNE